MTEATTVSGPCQVQSKTESPCPRPAVVEIRGVPFCEPCACEQEAYFAIGELTQWTRRPRGVRLGALGRVLRGGAREALQQRGDSDSPV